MVKHNKARKGERFAGAKSVIPFYTDEYFNKKSDETEEETLSNYLTLAVKIDENAGSDKSNFVKERVPTIDSYIDNPEGVLKAFVAINDVLMSKKRTGVIGEDIMTALKYHSNVLKTPQARTTFIKAKQEARKSIVAMFYELDPMHALKGNETDLSEVPWRLSEDESRSFIINEKQFHEWMLTRVQATDREKEYHEYAGKTQEEYYEAIWKSYSNKIINVLNKTIFGEKYYNALETQKTYMQNHIVKPFMVPVREAYQRLDDMANFLIYMPPTTKRGQDATDEQWAAHRSKYSNIEDSDFLRSVKYNVLPEKYKEQIDSPAYDDYMAMEYNTFFDTVLYHETKDAKERAETEAQREKLKKRKVAFDEDSTERIPRKQKDKNSRTKRNRDSYEKDNESKGAAKYCALCAMAGKPDHVVKTHNAKDCRSKSYYQRKLSGGAGSKETAKKDWKKEHYKLLKKLESRKAEARELRAKAKRESKRRRLANDARYLSSDDESTSSTASSGGDTDIGF